MPYTSASEVYHDEALYKSTFTLTFTFTVIYLTYLKKSFQSPPNMFSWKILSIRANSRLFHTALSKNAKLF